MIDKYEKMKKKKELREYAEEVLDKLIDNFEYLLELKLADKLRFENEFDFFVVKTLSTFQKLDLRAAKVVMAERLNPDLIPKRKGDNKINPIDETLNKLQEDVNLSLAKFERKTKTKIKIKSKEVRTYYYSLNF